MATNWYLRDLCNQLHTLDINDLSISNLQHMVQQKCSIPIQHQRFWHNGKRLTDKSFIVPQNCSHYNEISISLSLSGGKGGFGSMLRAAGKLNKTTNKSAMRDLSGRRQRFVEQEKELTQWFKEQKSNKSMTQQEIQNDFRHIKQYGTLPEKRMCHRGIHCRYKHKCRFVHPDDAANEKAKHKTRSSPHLNLYSQTDEEMRNALLIGQINAKSMQEKIKHKRQQTKNMIQLYGDDTNSNEDDDIITNIHSDTNAMKEVSHEGHEHALKWIMRDDCDFIICDVCSKAYKGPSWHCAHGCDFDICDDCVVIDSSLVAKDKHIMEYNKKPQQMKEIEQQDQIAMNLKVFSRVVDRKRKRKEKNLGLLGLENAEDTNKETNDKHGHNVDNKTNANDTKVSNDPMNVKRISEMNPKKGKIDLIEIKDVQQLKTYGMDALKEELKLYGLKCGGTLQERAERLFLLRDKRLCDLPKNVFVPKKKKIKRPPRKKQRLSQ